VDAVDRFRDLTFLVEDRGLCIGAVDHFRDLTVPVEDRGLCIGAVDHFRDLVILVEDRGLFTRAQAVIRGPVIRAQVRTQGPVNGAEHLIPDPVIHVIIVQDPALVEKDHAKIPDENQIRIRLLNRLKF